jgi:hypothetical protein
LNNGYQNIKLTDSVGTLQKDLLKTVPFDEACTGAYQQDRVDVLKLYSDYQWSYDPTSYVIFEHLGTDAEEQQWANYRVNEGKGVMMWDNLTGPLVKTPWVTILIVTSTESILKIMDSLKEEMSLWRKS